MLEAIEKLLILQDRDRKILRVRDELAHVAPERQDLTARAVSTQGVLDAAKLRVKQIESERKKLELDVEAKQQQINKYAGQQLLTKKNEEYRALAHEIEMAKEAIVKIEDQEIVFMEQAETAQKQVVEASATATAAKKLVDGKLAELATREAALSKELAELDSDREELASAVDEITRSRYERLLKQKGQNVVVGITHSSCGGCHMKLQRQVVVSCQAEQEIVTCPNCGRILYFTRDMDLAVTE